MEWSKRKQQPPLDSSLPTDVVRAAQAAREYVAARDGRAGEPLRLAGPEPFQRDRRASEASADAIMARVHQMSTGTESQASHPALRHASGLRVAMLALAAVLVAALSSIATMGVIRSSGTVEVRFVLSAPEASSVMLAADFNQWTPEGHALKRSPDGHWEITVPLQKGKAYAYNFVIDGKRWIVDPSSASRLEDGFGGSSSTISL